MYWLTVISRSCISQLVTGGETRAATARAKKFATTTEAMIAKWVRKHCAGLLVQFQGNLAGESFRLHSTLLSALGQRKHTPKPGRKLFTRTTKDFPQSQAQTTKPVLTRWERMGRQTHPSYQCETYAFFFLLGSEFLGRTERSELSSSQLVKKQGGEVRRGGEAAHRCLPFRSRFCSTKPAPQKGALPPWKGSLWDLPRLLGNLSKNPPETFTQPPAEKTGEKKKAGSLTWDEPGKRPRQMGKSDQKCSGIPHPIYGKQVCEPSGKKPANPHET